MEQNTLEVTERSEVFVFASLREMVNQALHQNFGEVQLSNGISSGFKDLDKVINGFKKGQITTIAVKPGMGKTALMLSIANNVAIKNNHAVAIFSSERSSLKITNRLIESETGMSLEKLKNGKLKPSERDHMFSLVNNIAKADIYLDDTQNLSVDELALKARQLKLSNNIELIIIDYLELMTTTAFDQDSREQQLSTIITSLKDIAEELNVPILLFSQIPGQYPANVLKRPVLSDMPSYISDHSDVVLFLYRSDLNIHNSSSAQESDMVEVIVAKNNDQKQEHIIQLRFIESLAKFADK
jgi:replicative DNA helicase